MTDVTAKQQVGSTYDTQNLSCTKDTAMLTTAFTTTMEHSYIDIYITPTQSSTLSFTRLIDSTTTTSKLNAGVALTAGSNYSFTIRAKRGESYNLLYGETDTIIELYLMEVL